MNLIELRDIRKTFYLGEVVLPVLKGITLTIAKGEMVALTGVSGSGKSTLMNTLGCLDRPTSGDYLLDGEEVTRLSNDARALMRNQKMGFVFQNFNLLARSSALAQVMLPLLYGRQHISQKDAMRRAQAMLERLGLADRMDHQPSQLSGGQQQRVALARALINNPPFLLADEPTGNLDSNTTREVLALFKQLNDQDGITILIVTHDPKVAATCKRVIRMADGLIEADEIQPEGIA
ncbi:MAG: ABC transporter ATP-binding protein [Verrucomicrobia bacterium]|nr:ABC transporter ATP-binding protein [Verrucomicrobiota bacterium]